MVDKPVLEGGVMESCNLLWILGPPSYLWNEWSYTLQYWSLVIANQSMTHKGLGYGHMTSYTIFTQTTLWCILWPCDLCLSFRHKLVFSQNSYLHIIMQTVPHCSLWTQVSWYQTSWWNSSGWVPNVGGAGKIALFYKLSYSCLSQMPYHQEVVFVLWRSDMLYTTSPLVLSTKVDHSCFVFITLTLHFNLLHICLS